MNARHEMTEEALRLYSDMIYIVIPDNGGIRATSKIDPKKAQYFSYFGHKHGREGLQFWQDTNRIVQTAHYMHTQTEIAWPEVLNNWEEVKHTLPMAEVRHYHETASNYNQQALRELQLKRAAEDEERNKKAIEMYDEYAQKLKIPEGMKLLTKANEFLDEGDEMHHCISGYFGYMNLFFKIRHGNEKASMQMYKNGYIVQLYGPFNKSVSNNIRSLVKEFLELNGYHTDQKWVEPKEEIAIAVPNVIAPNNEGNVMHGLNPFVPHAVAIDM